MSVFVVYRLVNNVKAEQYLSSPESGSTSRIKTISDVLITLGHGSTAAGAWGDWIMWNRIYSASIWAPNGNAVSSEVKSTKTFYSTSRTLQTGQLAANPTPTPVTPAVGDASRINTIFKEIKTTSYGSESSGVWGDWGSMWNRIYSSAIWVPNGNATTADVVAGKTFYSNSRTLLTGISLVNGTVCVNNSDCFTGTCTTFYQDSDSDTYGNNSVTTKRCGTTYTGYSTNNTDCNDGNAAQFRVASAPVGGSITTSGSYRIHTFTGSGTFTAYNSGTVDVMVVAGGGNGGDSCDGCSGAGGGGGGGVIRNTAVSVSSNAYSVTVGGRGANSSFNGVNAGAGGYGGGGGGTSGNGYPGGGGHSAGGGGGGGAGAAGTNELVNLCGGGNGLAYDISGASTYYGGGGGCGNWYGWGLPPGGAGGGGNGCQGHCNGGNATYYGGGGGGASGGNPGPATGGLGYQGIVIIRYLTSFYSCTGF